MQKKETYARHLLSSIAKEINKPVENVEPYIKMFHLKKKFSFNLFLKKSRRQLV